MSKWNLIVDVALCENCHNCSLATKDEYIGNSHPGYAAPMPKRGHDWIRIERKVRGTAPMVDAAYLPTMCNHCDDAPCLKAGDGAVRKRGDGIVVIDPDKAKGRRDLVSACPYGAITWNDELGLPQTWTFDAHLLDAGWKEPRCTQVCPTGAMKAVKADAAEMAARAAREGLAVLRPELGTRPRVYYRHLQRYNSCFIGGSVLATIDGVTDCVQGAKVALRKDGREVAQAMTDTFGDFKCDGLAPGSGSYQVQISHPVHGSVVREVKLQGDDSQYLGSIHIAQRAAA